MSVNLKKRFALRLVRHAAAVLPPAYSDWGAAMQHEIEYIHEDRAALAWALGCVSTSYSRRIFSLSIIRSVFARWFLAFLVASWAISGINAGRLFWIKMSVESGIGTSSSDYCRLMLNLIPTWTLLLGGIAGLLFIAAAYGLVRKHISSPPVLLAGSVLSSAACLGQLPLLKDCQVALAESLRRDYILFALQLCIILLIWQAFRWDEKSGFEEA